MPNEYSTVVPLVGLKLDSPLKGNIAFSQDLILTRLPDWIFGDNKYKDLSRIDREALKNVDYAFVMEYQASSLGEPSEDFKYSEERSVQEIKYETAVLCNVALWLAKPSRACFDLVFHNPKFEEKYHIQSYCKHSRLVCHPKDQDSSLSVSDLDKAKNIHIALCQLKANNCIWTAIHTLWSALTIIKSEVRYLLLWVALEALLGPENPQEIRYRLAQRIGFFLASDKNEAREFYQISKKGYDFRSKIVHGRIKNRIDLAEYGGRIESILQRVLIKALLEDQIMERIIGKNRELYLNDLCFQP